MSHSIGFSALQSYATGFAGHVSSLAEIAKVQACQIYSTVTNKVSGVAESIIPFRGEMRLMQGGLVLLEERMKKLVEGNTALTDQVALLQKQAAQCEAAAKSLRETCSMMNPDLVESKKLVKQLTEEKEAKVLEVLKVAKERDEYKQKFDGFGGVAEIQNKEIGRLSTENQQLGDKIKQLTASRDSVRALHNDSAVALATIRNQCHELEKRCAGLESDRFRLQGLFDGSQKELEALKGKATSNPDDLSLLPDWNSDGK